MLALVVAFGIFLVGWGQYSIRQRTDELSRQVAALAKGQAVGDRAGAPNTVTGTATAEARDRLLGVEAGLLGAALFVTGDDGTVLHATTPHPPAWLPLARLKRTDANGASSGVLRTAAGVQVVVVSAPINAASRLVAVQGLREIRQTQLGILLIAAGALAIAAIVAYIAGGLLARRLTAPLVRLQGAAESVAAGAFGTQVAEEGDAETVSLAHSFNGMSQRVASAYAAQKSFVGDVSHEIRTPLTSIRGYAEALLDGTVSEPAQQRRALEVIRDESVRINEVAQTLLALSELDAGAVQVACEPVDLALLADALHGRFAGTAADARVTLAIALPARPRPIGDPERLLQALSAPLANAIAHTPTGGTVRVSAVPAAAKWRVAVDDSGPGIPADKRDEVFRRFARLDASRSQVSGGAGLGLAICKRLVELMGGAVGVEDSDLGGARVWIELPVSRG